MRPLTPTEAINPALEHTKALLLQPFRLRTFLKLSAIALIAEAGGGLGFSGPGNHRNLPHTTPAIQAALLALAIAIGVGFLLLGIVLFYVSSRLQLVLVELVATRNTRVAPAWRWIGLRLLILFVFVAISAAIMLPFLLTFLRHPHSPGTTPPGLFRHLLLMLALLAPAFLLFITAYILLRDFALPPVVFEDLPLTAALRRLRSLLAAEPGPIALYVLLRLLLGLGMAILAEVAFAIAALLSLIPIALLGGGPGSRSATPVPSARSS